jgi:hypothetical protein
MSALYMKGVTAMANEFPIAPGAVTLAGNRTENFSVSGGPVNPGDVVTLRITAGIGRLRILWVEKESGSNLNRNRIRVFNPGPGAMSFRIRYGSAF